MAISLFSRARLALALAFLFVSLVAQPLAAQPTEPLALPDIELEAGGAVFALARLPDGRIVLGGEFSSVNGQIRNNLAMVDADGLLIDDWAPNANGEVRVIATGGADEIFVGGDFSEIDSQPRLRLAKLSTIAAPGSRLDPTWNPGADGAVLAMAYDSAGALFVGGTFGNIGGGSRPRLAKLGAGGSGALIVAFQPGSLNGGPLVQALALDEAGNQVYAGGQVAGPGGRQFLRRYQRTTGARDAWNPDPNGRISALHLAVGGGIFVGGEFTTIAGQARQRLARVTTATTSATLTAFSANVNGRITAFALDSADADPANHRLYVAGEYSSIGGQPRERLARLAADSGAVDGAWTPNPNGDVFAVVLSGGNSGRLVAGGPFSRIGGLDARGIARLLDANGGKDIAFAANAVQAGIILSLRTMADGSTFLGGIFDAVRNAGDPVFETGFANLLRLDANGELDVGWKPQVNGSIRTMRADGSSLLLGGGFVSVDAQPRDRLARMIDVGAVLVLDSGWTPGTDGVVRDLQLADGALFAGGEFQNAGDGIATAARANLARFDAADGLLSLAFTPPALDARVLALAVADGAVFAGGEFTLAGGQGRNALARFDATSGTLDAWNPGATLAGLAGSVRALAPVNGNGLLVAGSFDTLGGVARSNLGRVHLTTGVTTGYYAPEVNGPIDALVLDSTGAAHIGGRFSAINGDARQRLARLGQVGDIDQVWAPTADGDVLALAMRADGNPDLFAAGSFLNVSGQPRVGVAAIPTVPDDIADTSVVEVTGVSASVTGQAFTASIVVTNLDDPARSPTGIVSVNDGTHACGFTLLEGDAGSGACLLPGRNASESPRSIVAFFESDDADLLSAISDPFAHVVAKADTVLDIATVTPAQPTVGEPVEIVIGFAVSAPGSGTPLGLVTVTNGDDSCQIDIGLGADRCDLFFTSTGEHTVSASYPGDDDFNGDAASTVVAVSGVPVSVSITDIAPSPSVTGQGFTVNVLVEADNAMAPEGSVTIVAGDFGCGPIVLDIGDAGQGSCVVTATLAGDLSVVASFNGSGVYDSGDSPAVEHSVEPAATVIVASSNTPTAVGAAATVNATLSVIAPGAGTPVGDITVSADTGESCSIDRSLGQTSCDLLLAQAGTRTLTLSYAGDGSFLGSTEALLHEVEQAASSTSIDSSTPTPSAPGQTVTLAFSVAPVTAGGSVEIRRVDNDELVCAGGLVAGSGSCAAIFGSGDLGGVMLRAVYPGDGNHSSSVSAAYLHAVERIDTTLELSGPVAASAPGETVTFSWTLEIDPSRVPAGAPGGTIDVSDGNGNGCLGVDPADGGCSFAIADIGEYTFSAAYSGDAAYVGSVSNSVDHAVALVATGITLLAPTESTAPGESVTLTWTLTPDRVGATAPTGTVDISDGTDLVCEDVAVDAGECSFVLVDIGNYSYVATYSGDTLYAGSTSAPAAHEVARILTTTVLDIQVPDPLDIRVGDTVTFTWDVTAARTNFGTLDGSVDVVSGADSCSADVDDGVCEITLTVFGEAVSFVASYSGNAVFAPSDDVLTLEILETPRQVSFDAAISKRVLESLILLDGGDWVLFEIVVRNQGEDPIAAADVLDEMPAQFDIATVAWECEALAGAQCGATSGSGDLDDVVALPPGGSVRYLITGFIPQFSDDAVVGNVALVDAGEDDVDPTNNQDSAAYQRCEPNRQSDPGDLDLREHNCLFRNGYEALPLP